MVAYQAGGNSPPDRSHISHPSPIVGKQHLFDKTGTLLKVASNQSQNKACFKVHTVRTQNLKKHHK